jgi:hypothetical protein
MSRANARYRAGVDVANADESNSPPASSLPEALALAGWGPRDLARAVNTWLSRRGRADERIDLTAAYPWVRLGYCPHGSMPEIVATVLTDHLGVFVSATQLWPGHARAARSTSRTADLADGGGIDHVVRSLDQLVDGARPMPVGGPDLIAAVLDGIGSPMTPPASDVGRDRVLLPQAELIASHVTALRHLDDRQGGGALSLRYVTRELASVLDLVRSASYEPEVGQDLLTVVADLAQLVGWMHFDAGESAVAQRYLLLAIRVARAANDTGRMVNTIGMLAYVAAYTGNGADAVHIIATGETVPTSSRLLQARSAGRAASAHAAIGDLAAFRAAADRSQNLLASASGDDTSAYLYYLNPDQLSAEAGHGLLRIAETSDLFRGQLLKQAVELLTPLSTIGDDPDSQRSALLHGCQLARAHMLRRDLDGAVDVTRTALTRLREVQSGRCVASLRELRRDLAQRRRATVVGDFLPELDTALERA